MIKKLSYVSNAFALSFYLISIFSDFTSLASTNTRLNEDCIHIYAIYMNKVIKSPSLKQDMLKIIRENRTKSKIKYCLIMNKIKYENLTYFNSGGFNILFDNGDGTLLRIPALIPEISKPESWNSSFLDGHKMLLSNGVKVPKIFPNDETNKMFVKVEKLNLKYTFAKLASLVNENNLDEYQDEINELLNVLEFLKKFKQIEDLHSENLGYVEGSGWYIYDISSNNSLYMQGERSLCEPFCLLLKNDSYLTRLITAHFAKRSLTKCETQNVLPDIFKTNFDELLKYMNRPM